MPRSSRQWLTEIREKKPLDAVQVCRQILHIDTTSIPDYSLHDLENALEDTPNFIEQPERHPKAAEKNDQVPTVREIAEDRIVARGEEVFFRDR